MRTLIPARIAFALVGVLIVSSPRQATSQTADALAAADRLLAVQDAEATMRDMASNVSAQLPGATEDRKKRSLPG